MPDRYNTIRQRLVQRPQQWLITGVAGFIGSNLLEALLKLDQTVVGLDNFATGYQHNLDEVRSLVIAGAMEAVQVHRRRHPAHGRLRERGQGRRSRAARGGAGLGAALGERP